MRKKIITDAVKLTLNCPVSRAQNKLNVFYAVRHPNIEKNFLPGGYLQTQV